MKKVGRKAASILLTLCMLLTMLPVSALAVDEGTVDTAPAESTPAETPEVDATPAETPEVDATPAETPEADATPAETPEVEATPVETAENVAQIDSQSYATLEAAVTAVPASTETTIQLLQDVTLDSSLAIAADKNIVLDLAGHTLSISSDANVIENSGTLTIKNGIVAAKDKGSSTQGMAVNNLAGATLTVKQDEGKTTKLIGRSAIRDYGSSVTIYGGTIASYNRNAYWSDPGCKLVVYDGTFTSPGTSGMGRAISASGDVTIYGGVFHVTGTSGAGDAYVNAIGMYNSGTLTIQPQEGKTVTVISETDYAVATSSTVPVKIYGGSFACNGSRTDVLHFNSGSIEIYGGSFKHEPYADYLADNRVAVLENGSYVVRETTATDITVGSYEALVNALNGSILEPKNITIASNVTIPADANLTLQHGYTLTVDQTGTLTVEGILSLDGAMTNNGTLTVSNGGFIEYPLNLTNSGTITDYPVVGNGICTVSTPMQLQWISYMVEKGQTPNSIQLAQDIVMPDVYFTPIGQSEEIPYENSAFDGAGKKITGLKVAAEGDDLGSLFGVTENVQISDLTLSGGSVTSTNGYIGALAGLMKHGCIVSNVHIKNYTVSSPISYGVGGFAGELWTKNTDARFEFIGCTAENVTVTGYANVGGIWGTSTGSVGTIGIYNCDLAGSVTAINVNGAACGGYGATAPVEIIGLDYSGLTVTVKDTAVTDKLIAYTTATDNNLDYAGSEWEAVKNDDGTWGVVTETTYVAQIGETKHATLSEALNAVKDGETIKVLAPATVEMTETYAITGKAITLDLNGQTVTWNSSAKAAITVKDSGSLTIQDTSANEAGELAFTSTYTDFGDSTGIYVNPNGTFALQSGTISYTAAKAGRAIYVGVTGTFAMSGGTVKIAGRAKYGVYLSSNNSTNITGGEIILSDTLTGTTLYGLYVYMLAEAQGLAIENLTVDASAVPAAQCAYCITGGWSDANNAPVTISGGTYTTNENTLSKAIYYSTVKNLTISGGTFNGVVNSATTITDGTFQKAVVVTDTITGGTFEGNVTAPSGKISGGKFKVVNPPYDRNLADGKSFEQKDGYYCVVDDTNTKVAEVGDVQYATLEEAIKKAQSGQTVELLANATVLERIAIADKNITIDTNGYSVIYSGDADHKSAIIDLEGEAQVVVTGNGTFTFNDAYHDYNGFGYIFRLYGNSVLTIENGTYYAGLTCVQVGDSSAAYIKDGHFSASSCWEDTWWVLNRIDNNNSKFYVSGGTFVNYDPSNSTTENPKDNFCTPEYAATSTTDEEGNIIYTVVEAEARIGETGYVTLADAIAAAETNATITLLADVTEDVVVPTGKNITLDLNEHKITNVADHTITVRIGATLAITGTGTVDNATHAKAAIWNEGTVTLNGGAYTRSQENGNSSTDAGGNSYYNIVNHGTMTINSGVSVTQNGGFSSMIENGYYSYNSGNASSGYVEGTNAVNPELTINGGTFSGGLNTVKNDDGGKLTINDGTFTNTAQATVLNWNIATITGGTFTAGSGNCLLNGAFSTSASAQDLGQMTITGGRFTSPAGTACIANNMTGSLPEISGGTFSDEPDDAYLAEGYVPQKNEDGTWGVVRDNSVAEIVDGQKYESLIEAVNAAKVSGQTVKLLANVELQPVEGEDYALLIDNGESMTLDLNGHKITATLNNTAEFNLIKNYVELTITDTSEGKGGSIEVTENGSAEKARTSILYNGYDTGEFTLKAGALKLTGGANSEKTLYGVYSSGTTVVMNGGAIEVRRLNSDSEYSEAWDVYGIYNSNNCQTTVNGGTITVENQGRHNSAYGIFNASGTVSIHGNPDTPYIKANAFDEGTWYEHTLYGKITLYGGKYNMLTDTATGWIESDITIADGYEDRRNGDGTVSIVKSPVAQIGSTKYDTLEAAVAAVKSGETITMLTDVEEGSGIIVPSGSNFTIDFGGHTYTVTNNLAGSTGTKSQCFQLLKGSTITLKNGTIVANDSGISVIIQNYADLTLDGMTLDGNVGNNNVYDVLGVNHGNVTITGNTNITAKTSADPSYAFDVYYWPANGYGDGVTVTVDENMTGTIKGTILYGSDGTTAGIADVAEKAQLYIEAGTFVGQISTYNLDTDGKHGISISGGSFSEEPKEDYLAPYYEATQNTTGDGYWTVDVAEKYEATWTNGETLEAGTLGAMLTKANSAKAGTVALLQDVVASTYVHVSAGVTLDLAGHELKATDFNAFGDVVDSTEGEGLLKLQEGSYGIRENNPSLPIYDSTAGGYRLYTYQYKELYAYEVAGQNTVQFWFELRFDNTDAWKLLASGATHGLRISSKYRFSEADGWTELLFNDAVIQKVAKLVVNDGRTQDEIGFYLNVTSIDLLGERTMSVMPKLYTATDVTCEAGVMTYSLSQAAENE